MDEYVVIMIGEIICDNIKFGVKKPVHREAVFKEKHLDCLNKVIRVEKSWRRFLQTWAEGSIFKSTEERLYRWAKRSR